MKLQHHLKISCFLLTSLIATASQAFCVYNSTTGNDTIRYMGYMRSNYNAPTEIDFLGIGEGRKTVDQGDYKCMLTERRGLTDVTTVNVYVNFDEHKIPTLICSHNLYNRGGYMVVKGDVNTGFQCDVYRDKIKKYN